TMLRFPSRDSGLPQERVAIKPPHVPPAKHVIDSGGDLTLGNLPIVRGPIRALPDSVGPHSAAVDSGADDADTVIEPGAVEPGDDQLTGGGEFAIGELIPPGPIKRPIR